MAFDHWWFGTFVDREQAARIKPEFAKAAAIAMPSPEARAALDAWRMNPRDFEDAAITTDEAGDRANRFIWAFNLPGFDDLAQQVLGQNGAFASLLTEAQVFRFVSTARTTPVSIVWHALGAERACALPGTMGNLLVHPDEVEEAARMTQRAYAGTEMRSMLDAARRYCGTSVSDEDLEQVLGFLPEGLAQAGKRGSGFLALARPQM